MNNSDERQPNHLAWHETLEVHELVAFQSIGLMKLKMFIGEVKDAELRKIYEHTIKGLENNLEELLRFYSLAPRSEEEAERDMDTGFFAGDLLAFAKTAVRNYAIAITETATPALRETLNKQLQAAIRTHEMIFNYMYRKSLYPSYDLEKLLQNDIRLASKAIKLRY
ncbi:spore coat protein [Oceanobacillus damuensis]|uniref:spore coat protein n=1 Tax=Oceanobacillus damuensis TaxID=937928 RepID=UPI0008356792|nr:spore coat protein [Oceanobacillus damuensis]